MATSNRNVRGMNWRAQSSSNNHYNVETEDSKSDTDSGNHVRKFSGNKHKIRYDREILIKLFHSPASTRKPKGFPIPHLDCTLGTSKVQRLPINTTRAPPPAAYQLRRRIEPERRSWAYRDERPYNDEKEPEWFSSGPSSQHETIELRGFLDDDRREKSDGMHNGVDKDTCEENGEVDSSGESTKNDNARESPMDLSIEKILKLDQIPGFLQNDMLESEEPSGSSRFSQFFKRNSVTPDPNMGRNIAHALHQQKNGAHNNEDKNKGVHEMGELLRNMLIKKNEPSPQREPQQSNEQPMPMMMDPNAGPAKKDDVDAFKKLLTPLLERVLQGPATHQPPQMIPVQAQRQQQPQQFPQGGPQPWQVIPVEAQRQQQFPQGAPQPWQVIPVPAQRHQQFPQGGPQPWQVIPVQPQRHQQFPQPNHQPPQVIPVQAQRHQQFPQQQPHQPPQIIPVQAQRHPQYPQPTHQQPPQIIPVQAQRQQQQYPQARVVGKMDGPHPPPPAASSAPPASSMAFTPTSVMRKMTAPIPGGETAPAQFMKPGFLT